MQSHDKPIYLPAQQEVIAELHLAQTKEVLFVAGKGCGKSHIGADMLISHACVPGSVTFMGAASETIMGISTTPALIRQAKAKGLVEGTHFVIGKMPTWPGVQPYSGNVSTRNIITWRWGSYTIFKTLSDPEAVEGAQFDFAWIDEYGLMDIPNVRRMIRDRMRGECYSKLGKKHQMLFTGTPPNMPTQLSELRKIKEDCDHGKTPEIAMIFGKTIDNPFLPDDFIDYNKDPINFRRDYEGSLEMPPTNMWYYNFDRTKHIGERELIDGLFYVWHDFNKNPGTALIIQHSREGKWIHVHDEIYLNGSDLAGVCQMVKSRYPKTHRYILGGDAMGHAGTHLQLGKTSFKVMLQEYKADEKQLVLRKKNPFHSDSNLLTNAILALPPEVLKVTISSKCTEFLKDLELVGMGQDYDFDLPDSGRGHLADAWRYYLWDNWRDVVKWSK